MAGKVQTSPVAARSSLRVRSGFSSQQCPQLVLMAGDNAGLAARAVMLGAEVAEPATLLEELFDQAQRNPEPPGHRLAGARVIVVGGQYPFPQIQGDGFHASTRHIPNHSATDLFNLL